MASGKVVYIRRAKTIRRRFHLLITVWALWRYLQPKYDSEKTATSFVFVRINFLQFIQL